MARTQGERRMGLVFRLHIERAWQTVRKMGFCGLDLLFHFWAEIFSEEELAWHGHERPTLMYLVAFWGVLPACHGEGSCCAKRMPLPSQEGELEHLHLLNICRWRARIRHPVISSCWFGSIFPPEWAGFPQQPADLSHRGKALSTPWGVGLLGYGAHPTDSRRQIYLNTYLPVKASSLSDSYF